MDASEHTLDLTEHHAPEYHRGAESAEDGSSTPPEILRDVAACLKSLAKVLPYDEYVAVLHQIARVKWRCALADHAEAVAVDVAGSTGSPHVIAR